MLVDLTIKDFLAGTAGGAPAPGDGSILALNGAIAAALTEMVTHLTAGKKKYAEAEGQMETIVTEAVITREHPTEYIGKDNEAYNRTFSVFKLPKETSDEQVVRTNAIQNATEEVAIVPMRVTEEIGSVTEMIIYAAHKGNQNAVTNARVAMMTTHTCVLGALLNVRINLTSTQDETFVGKMRKKMDEPEASTIRVG